MQKIRDQVLFSPTDLVRFLGCNPATALELLRLRDPDAAPARAEDNALAELVQQAGLEHEERLVGAATLRCLAMDETALFIQGPLAPARPTPVRT